MPKKVIAVVLILFISGLIQNDSTMDLIDDAKLWFDDQLFFLSLLFDRSEPSPPSNEAIYEPGFHDYALEVIAPWDDPNKVLPNGRTALTQAAFDGERDELNRLYKFTNPHNINLTDANGDNALIAAVAGGHYTLAEKLIKMGSIIDRAAFKRLSKTLSATDPDTIQWWLRTGLPFADPQIVKVLNDGSDSTSISEILGAGYRPTREEAITILEESLLSDDDYLQLYSHHPDLFTPENSRVIFDFIGYDSASPRQRLLLEALFPTIPNTDEWDFHDMVKSLPYDLLVTHPDYKELASYYVDTYCNSDDQSAVVLLDSGVKCNYDNPFGEAVEDNNYALVQRYIDMGTNPQKAIFYDKPIIEEALDYPSEENLEMAKLLIDNGAATPDQVNRFYSMMYKVGNKFDRYRPYANFPLKLAASPQDDLYVLSYSNEEKRYQLSKQDTTGAIIWDQVLGGERFFNILNNPVGLYFTDDKLLLVENHFIDGRQKTRVNLFSDNGELLKQVDVKGVFDAFIMQNDGYALTTNRTTVYYDKSLKSLGDINSYPDAFMPAVPQKTVGILSMHRYFAHDFQKQDYYSDRTLILFRPDLSYTEYSSPEPPRRSSRYLATIVSKDGDILKTARIGGGELTPMDYALSDSHAYIILAGPEQVVIQKRTSDFEVKSFHYLDLDQSPFATTIDNMSCDTVGCTIVGKADNNVVLIRTVPGTKEQTLGTTNVYHDFSTRGSDDDPKWQVARMGEQDFISGSLQLRFQNAKPTAKGEAVFLEQTLGLLPGVDGSIYAFGSHNKDAAYEVLNAQGELLGHHEFDFGYAESHINEMQRLPDGKLLVIGHIYQYYHFFRTFAALLTPEGEQIWSRVYHDMDSMHGLLVDSENNLFYAIGGGKSVVKLSLEDGSLIKQLVSVRDLNRLLRTSQGRIIGLGENEQSYGDGKYDKVKQPIAYCLSSDETTFTAQILGEAKDRINAAAPWGDGLVVAYTKIADGSVRSNAVLAKIDAETCQISFDWKP